MTELPLPIPDEIADLRTAFVRLNRTVSDLGDIITEKSDRIVELKAKVARLTAENERLRSDLAFAESQRDGALEERDEAEGREARLTAERDALAARVLPCVNCVVTRGGTLHIFEDADEARYFIGTREYGVAAWIDNGVEIHRRSQQS